MTAILVGLLTLAIVYVAADGVIKIRHQLQRNQRPVGNRRYDRLHVIDPLLDGPDQ